MSAEVINLTMRKRLQKSVNICLNLVDVRDVARAHINSLLVERAKNKRFIVAYGPVWFEEMIKALAKEFSADYDLPKGKYTLEEVQAGAKAGNGVMA